MGLIDRVRIAPRFQRAVRIDVDLGQPAAADNFLCTASFARALKTLAEQVNRTGQGAFTWTGPYGGGKSSLVVALGTLLGPRGRARDLARASIGPETANQVLACLKPGSEGWRVVPVIGSRADPAAVIWEALHRCGALRDNAHTHRKIDEATVLQAVERVAQRSSHAGLLLVIDELGRILEHLAASSGDLHFFQELAEKASRSNGRLIVLGVLHQAFDEYARRLGKEAREEWGKVQGRYLDIPLSVTGSEQLEILARAIQSEKPPADFNQTVDQVTRCLKAYRPDTPSTVGSELRRCWPLHPVTACLLGPISRRRFGQNQRSLFAFLNSFEPGGFQEFLKMAGPSAVYAPDQLYDYLQLNLEPAILASPDGHRWSLAVEALARAEKHHANPKHMCLLKAIALLDLFRERSGLYASEEVLSTVIPGESERAVRKLLEELKAWSVVAYREHLRAYAIYAGSDFDLQVALDEAVEKAREPDLSKLRQLANLRPVVAKRHYHDTGALRWFDVDVIGAPDVDHRVSHFKPNGAMGQLLLIVPASGESLKTLRTKVRHLTTNRNTPLALGISANGDRLLEIARELLALEYIRTHRPELSGDAVARREVDARTAWASSTLQAELRSSFTEATWMARGEELAIRGLADLARLASDMADCVYPNSPRIPNELLNRSGPSSNAVAAQKALLKAMVSRSTEARLGIDGFPAEGGLYESILNRTGIHRKSRNGYAFLDPQEQDPARLKPLWAATDSYLERATTGPVSALELYSIWGAAPFGVRAGLRPILLIAYLMSRATRYTIYLDNQFEVTLNELTVDRLTQDPAALTVRAFDAGDRARRLFAGMGATVERLRPSALSDSSDLVALARAIVGIVREQPPFTQRTARLSSAALAVRSAIRAASDPNTLLYETLPRALEDSLGGQRASVGACVELLEQALTEIVGAYNRMLRDIDANFRRELGTSADANIEDLHARAARIQGLTGDYRLEAFIGRVRTYRGEVADCEGVAGFAANKPSRDWSDNDVDRSMVEIADLAQRFNRAEAFARVKGRPDGRHAIAFVVGLDRTPELVVRDFEIKEPERRAVLELARELKAMLREARMPNELVLAAIAKVGSDLISRSESVAQPVSGP